MQKQLSTKEKILKEGRSLLQMHGYNGFSFQDIADIIKIKKPSLYDHYSNKEELIIAIIQNYSTQFDDWSQKIEPLTSVEKIQKVFEVFHAFSSDKRKICPVLALSADQEGLTKDVQKEIKKFVDKWLIWLDQQIKVGQKNGQIRKDIDSASLANFIYSQGLGTQLQSRIKDNPALNLLSRDIISVLLSRPENK